MSHVLDTPDQIARYQLWTMFRAFAFEIDSGMKLTSRMPTVKDVCALYKFEGVRTKKQLTAALQFLVKQVDEGEANYEMRDGRCFFSIGIGSDDEFAEAIKNA